MANNNENNNEQQNNNQNVDMIPKAEHEAAINTLKTDHEAALAQAKESVRNEEKNKLYPEINKLKNEKEAADNKVTELNSSVTELTTKVTELETKLAEKEKELTDMGANSSNNEENTKKLSELESKIQQLTDAMAVKDAEVETMKKQKEVAEYRTAKIKEIPDADFHDLVFGDTKEQVDATFAKAKAAYDKVAVKLSTVIPGTPKVPAAILDANSKLFENVSSQDILSMTAEQWKEQREKFGFRKK